MSSTQNQANEHVQSIAALFETLGVQRLLNQYGASRGWRQDRLRTATGFSVAAFGLDAATRGVKIERYRPDLIVFDDVDSQDDSTLTIEKKLRSITTAIIPAGSPDCAVLFVQNLIRDDGILAMLADGSADFIRDREPVVVEPAVRDLRYEVVEDDRGRKLYRITGGEATWPEGQSLEVCEAQLNEWGERAFRREAQHEVRETEGYVFAVANLGYCNADEVPALATQARAWDLAATEGGGDWTAGVRMGRHAESGRVYVLDVRRGQWSSDRVMSAIEESAQQDGPGVRLRLPQDPGQAGKDQAARFRHRFAAYRPVVTAVTGDKATRASGFAEEVNRGNVVLLRAAWNAPFVEELRRFREDVTDQVDDQVDAAADAYGEVRAKRVIRAYI